MSTPQGVGLSMAAAVLRLLCCSCFAAAALLLRCSCVAAALRLCCGCSAAAVLRLRCGCAAGLRLCCGCVAAVLRLHCGCVGCAAAVLRLHCSCAAAALRLRCGLYCLGDLGPKSAATARGRLRDEPRGFEGDPGPFIRPIRGSRIRPRSRLSGPTPVLQQDGTRAHTPVPS